MRSRRRVLAGAAGLVLALTACGANGDTPSAPGPAAPLEDPTARVLAPRAERWTVGLASQASRTDTHDLGFMIFNSFGQQYRLTGDAHARGVALTAARSLATRYNPAVGAIKSWDRDEDQPASWRFPVIIDNMMNLELLYWAPASPEATPPGRNGRLGTRSPRWARTCDPTAAPRRSPSSTR